MSTDVLPVANTLSDQVAEEIRALMARRRTSGRELARRLAVSPAWISYRLTGAQPIDLNDMERIAVALGVTVVDLLPRSRREVTVTYANSVPVEIVPAPRGPLNPFDGAGRTSRVNPSPTIRQSAPRTSAYKGLRPEPCGAK